MARRTRFKTYTSTLGECLGCVSDLQDLAEEMGSWRDGMDGTGLENTEKYELVSTAADELEEHSNQLEHVESDLTGEMEKQPEWNEMLEEELTYTVDNGSKQPRWKRRDNALASFQAAVEFFEGLEESKRTLKVKDDDGEEEEVELDWSELKSAVEGLESVEFPSMYG